MNRGIRHRVATWFGAVGLLLLSSGQAQYSSGQAQYVNSVSGQRFSTMWAAHEVQISQRMMTQNIITDLGKSGATSTSTAAPTTPTYKYALSRTDFKFQGKPTGQKNCEAISETPDGRKLLSDLCLQIFTEIQKLPELRVNNLASGLALVIGLSLQVARGTELTEEQAEQLLRGVNDLLVDTPGIQKLSTTGRQELYETWVMTGGLISAVAQAGAEANDEPTSALAKALANTVLEGFGFQP